MNIFKNATGYEKGLIARFLLQILIKQGSLEEINCTPNIVTPVKPWQLRLLANFSEDMVTRSSRE